MDWMNALTPIQKKVVFAALAAMQDIHTPQDNLNEQEWDEADKMWVDIEKHMNK